MVKVIDKTLNILELFLDNAEEYSLTEIAKSTRLNITTASRIISNLLDRGYLTQSKSRGKYSLGMKFLDFSGAIKNRIKLVEQSLSFMTDLSININETVILTLKQGEKSLVTSTVGAKHVLRTNVEEGERFPLYCTAPGKAILSFMKKEELEQYFNNTEMVKYTSYTITDFNKLKKQLLDAKREGFAFDKNERIIGVSSVASVIRDNQGKVIGSVGAICPSVRMTKKRLNEIAPYVRDCANNISKAIGFRGE